MLSLIRNLKNLFLFFFVVGIADTSALDKNYQNEGIDFAKKQIGKIKKLKLEEVLDNKENLKMPQGEGVDGESCKDCFAELIDSKDLIKKINREIKGDAKPGDKEAFANEKILVFISFSMPKNSINELNQESSKYGAELYLRGIFEKSFKKTAEKILEVNPKGLKLEINPNEFKKYKIEKVPTFVLLKDGKEVSRLLGNVSLEYANSKLRESK